MIYKPYAKKYEYETLYNKQINIIARAPVRCWYS